MITKEELEEVVEELGSHKGRHTELITVYVPAGYDINSVQRQLEAEKSTAKNIKSTATRKNVIDALEKIIRYLKGVKKTPENGLALFSGNVSKVEGQQDLQLWNIEPPMPLKVRIYRCDKEFVLAALRQMLEVTEVYGLLVMDRKEATIGLLEGKRIETIQKMTSGIPSKVRAGGQCLSPETLVMRVKKNKLIKDIKKGEEIKALDLESNKIVFTKIKNKWKVVKNKYVEINVKELCWPIITSEDHTFFKKEKRKIVEVLAKNLKKGDYLINTNDDGELFDMAVTKIRVVTKKIEMIDLETQLKNFFANWVLVHNSSQRFHRITEGLTKEFYKRIADEMKKIFFNMPKLKGILIGGPIPTKDEFLDNEYMATKLQDLVIGRLDIGGSDESGLKELVKKGEGILADQEIIHEKKILEKLFQTLGERPDMATLKEPDTKQALEYGAVETLILSKSLSKNMIKELTKIAENTSSNVEIVSTDTEEGAQFKNLGGIGSILRFRV
jgi:peptide subunit release factor 1 (eRF1)